MGSTYKYQISVDNKNNKSLRQVRTSARLRSKVKKE
jgi:hypothetical protein